MARNRLNIDNPEMGTQQLLDALTDHMSLYHSSALSPPQRTKGSLQWKLMEWFRALTIERRRSVLTISDKRWVAVVLQMQKRLEKDGYGYFFLLTDVCENGPTSSGREHSHSIKPEQETESRKFRKASKSRKKMEASLASGDLNKASQNSFSHRLPEICFRRAKGLLSRLGKEQSAGDTLYTNLEVGSTQTELEQLSTLDTISVSEELLSNVEQLFSIMESISRGKFLSSAVPAKQDSPWEELPWLQSMGYYSLAAFIVNKIELTMWSAWLKDEGVHRPPRNLANELRKGGRGVKTSGNDASGSTICQRNKQFKDWWEGLGEDVRCKAMRLAMAKSVKVEVMHTVRPLSSKLCFWEYSLLDEPNKKFTGPDSIFGQLRAIENIALSSPPALLRTVQDEGESQADYSKWFYDFSLGSADTLTGRVTRRVRAALQHVMMTSMELELLEGDNRRSQPSCEVIKNEKRKDSRRKKNKSSSQSKPQRIPEDTTSLDTCVPAKEQCVHPVNQTGVLENSDLQKVEKKKQSKTEAKKKKKTRTRSQDKDKKDTTNIEFPYEKNGAPEKDTKHKHDKVLNTAQSNLNLIPEMPSSVTDTVCKDGHAEPSCDMPTMFTGSPFEDKVHKEVSDNAIISEEECSNSKCLTMESLNISELQDNSNRLPTSGLDSNQYEENIQHSLSEADAVVNGCSKVKPVICKVRETDALSSSAANHTPTFLSKSSYSSHLSRDRYWEGIRSHTFNAHNSAHGLCTPHEWPGTFQVHFTRGRSQIMPPATERLHLDVGMNKQQRLQASLMAMRSPIVKQQSGIGSNSKWNNSKQHNFKSSDCAQLYPSGYSIAQSRGYPFTFRDEAHTLCSSSFELNLLPRSQDEFKNDDRTPDDTDYDDSTYFSGDLDDHEGYIISEEESERQFLDLNSQGEGDYNKYFGGGVMFWNTADYAGMGYSRPPSLSSEDSSWARHEADLSLVLDDIMGLSPMSGAYANVASPGIAGTSPPTTTYHPGLEHNPATPRLVPPLAPHPSILAVKSEDEQAVSPNDVRKVGIVDGSVPVLRPIVVARQISTSESGRHQDSQSPRMHRGRREFALQRRPPSPVLRCVPPSPPPPPPSPVNGYGRRKGLTTVRSGSSSPRRWGLVNSYQKEQDFPNVLSKVFETAWDRSFREKSAINPGIGVSTVLHERFFAVPLPLEKDHPDVTLPMQTTLLFNSNPTMQAAITKLHNVLQKEIEGFCKQVAAENMLRKPSISTAVDKVTHAMRVLWPRSRLKIFGSNATGLALPCSDLDLVVCLPPVRNLEPIKEAGILEGRNGIKETCLQHAARYLADQDWVMSDTLKTIENTAIPIIMLVVHVPQQSGDSNLKKGPWGTCADREFVRLDISFESPSHTGLRTAELVRELCAQFPAIVPLALVLKQFLTDRSLDHPYTGGLSSYCLVLLITRFLQHQHHLGRPFQMNLGNLLMDFLHFFGCVFDPRRMGVCIRGGGMYVERDRGHSIDPLYIEDPLYPSNNVGRNCFRILQCVKAFAEAYSCLEKDLLEMPDQSLEESPQLLCKILPSVLELDLFSEH